MLKKNTMASCCLIITMLLVPVTSIDAGMLGSAAAKVAARKAAQRTAVQMTEKKAAMIEAKAAASKAARQESKGIIRHEERSRLDYAYDKQRDGMLPVKRLAEERKVYKYYENAGQARQEMAQGIPAKRHMTASGPGQVGRPIEGARAQSRYGLKSKAEARTTVTLQKGTPVRQGKVIGGEAGYDEITPQRQIPVNNISDLRFLH